MIIDIACMFMLYSVIGWIWETSYVSIEQGRFVNRGFLRSPVIPIYGFAATTIMLSMEPIAPILPEGTALGAGVSIIYIAFVATAWEYATSYFMEVLFKTRWWDYTTHRFNLNGRIALDVSCFWGIGGFVLWKYVNAPLMGFFYGMPERALSITLTIFYAIVAVDTAFTLRELIDLRTVVIKLHAASDDTLELMSERFERLQDGVEQWGGELEVQRDILFERLNEAKTEIKRKTQYSRFEGMKDFGRFIEMLVDKGESVAEEQEQRLRQYLEMLQKVRGHRRFFRHYPNAATRSLSSVLFAKRKDERRDKRH